MTLLGYGSFIIDSVALVVFPFVQGIEVKSNLVER